MIVSEYHRRDTSKRVRPLVPRGVVVLIACVLAVLAQSPSAAQEPVDEEAAIERGAEAGVAEEDLDALVEELEEYRRNPLRLREIDPEELARLPGIPIHLARSVLAFVTYNDPASLRELGRIQGITPEQLATLRAFTTLEPDARERPTRVALRLRASRDVQLRDGYSDTLFRITPRLGAAGDSLGLDTIAIGPRYLGGPVAALLRLDAESPSLSLGITIEKDPGEALAVRDTAGLGMRNMEYVDSRAARGITSRITSRITSFISGSLEARLGAMRLGRAGLGEARLIVGDYTADAGLGLAFGATGTFKGADPARGAERHPRGLKRHRSTDESAFLRGAAVEWRLPISRSLTATSWLLGSYRSLDGTTDARLSKDGSIERGISTIRTDGLHRTRSEVERSGTLDERLVGGRFELRTPRLRAGLTASFSRFSLPILAELPHEFEGDRVGIVALDAAWDAGGLRAFGEIAAGPDWAWSGIGGLSATTGGAELTLAVRSYSPSAFSLHGYAFGENVRMPANEQGIYAGFELRPFGTLRLTGYCDLYRIPERTRNTPLPRNGADLLLETEWRPAPRLPVRLRLHHEDGEVMVTVVDELGRPARRLERRERSGARLELELASAGERVRLRGRVERRMVAIPSAERRFGGTSASIDLRLRAAASLTLGLRGTIFSVEDAEATIYQVEAGLPGRSLRGMLTGNGIRLLATARWRPSPAVSIAGYFGETRYADRSAISDGDPQQIDGSVAGTVGIQVDVTL